MKINFDWQSTTSKNETTKTSQIIDDAFLLKRSKKEAESTYRKTIVDISDKVTDDFTYLDQGEVAEKLNGIADNESYLDVQRDFMTVMSHSMSASDFQKMKEEGFSINSMEPGQAVTILDKIKTVLAQSGTHIEGYNDNLSVEKITEITGNIGYAETIAKELSYANVPVTEENMEAIDQALDQALIMQEPKEDSIVYMIGQKMDPTLENFYKAEHSSGMRKTPRRNTGYASNAYSKQGLDTQGVRKTRVTEKDYLQLEKQIAQRIEADGLEVSSKNLEYGKWLLEKGLPITGENIERLEQLRTVKIPLDIMRVIRQGARGIAEGKSPFEVNLNRDDEGIFKEATHLFERYQKVTNQAVDATINAGKICSLKNLESYDLNLMESIPQLQARKTLEEVRLKMTVEANVKLLKSGYSIETAPMEDYIKQLELATKGITENLWGNKEAEAKTELFEKTVASVKQLPTLPIAIVGKIPFMEKPTIAKLVQEGEILRQNYLQAKNSYESIMTAPRSDLGDSIKKAFRNVDDILKDMDMEVNEANQRAIRIMGYNQISITEENLYKIKAADKQIRTIIDKLKPGIVLSMIREGKNPLEMSMNEVQDYITERENEFLLDSEKYSSFLYKLDKKKEIKEEEREAYIGIYRMLRQIEKSDGAVIGSLLEQNAEINFSNLLSAIRTRKAKPTDIKIDDFTGSVAEIHRKEASISEQIEKGFSKVNQFLESSNLHLKADDILKEVKQMQKDAKTEKEFVKEQMQEIRELEKMSVKENDFLQEYHQPITLDNLQSAYVLSHKRGTTFKKVIELEETLTNFHMEVLEEGILKKAEKFFESMGQEKTKELAYYDMISGTKEVLKESLDKETKYLDLKELQSLYKQLSLASDLAKEENYEIPIQIGEEVTSINLKVVHRNIEKREVRITMDTESFGKVDARFVETDKGLEGSVLTDYMDGKNRLEANRNRLQKALEEALKETKLEVKSIFFGVNEKLDLNTLQKIDNDKKTDISLLYKVAKEFIYYVKDIKET